MRSGDVRLDGGEGKMLSKSAVRKAGSVMRRQAEGKASQEEVERALAIVSAFRASFAGPLEAASGE